MRPVSESTSGAGAEALPGSAELHDATALPPDTTPRSLAERLADPLMEACGGCLSEIHWFRTDWQRGGAATAHATWGDSTPAGGEARDVGAGRSDVAAAARRHGTPQLRVVVKLPVNNRELTWMRRLQPGNGAPPTAVPRLLASGETLDHYDLAWIVIEELPHGPLGGRWHDDHIPRIARAIAAFAAAAAPYPVDRPVRREEWESLIATARHALRDNAIAERQRWRTALKDLSARLDALVAEWERRGPVEWIHGDLHFANAMSRVAIDSGDVCLIDFAEIRPGHWIEDAIYLERQLWARPERLKAHRPVKAIADARREVGVQSPGDYNRLAALRRCLLAATAPAFLKSEGAPPYLAACLERLEASLAQVA